MLPSNILIILIIESNNIQYVDDVQIQLCAKVKAMWNDEVLLMINGWGFHVSSFLQTTTLHHSLRSSSWWWSRRTSTGTLCSRCGTCTSSLSRPAWVSWPGAAAEQPFLHFWFPQWFSILNQSINVLFKVQSHHQNGLRALLRKDINTLIKPWKWSQNTSG